MKQVSLRRTLVQNFAFCTVIALVLWLLVPTVGQYGFFSCFIHSQAIGFSITLLAIAISKLTIAAGLSVFLARVLSIVVATPMGIVFGLWFAGTVLGLRTGPLDFLYDADQLLVTAVTAVIASLVFNWHLNRREKLMRLELIASEERRRADNARHSMLRAQLEPHMLFNTLANLRALIGSDTERAIEMLDRLDSFLRETLRSSQTTTNLLEREFTVLEDYLALMKIRMGDRLQYSLSLADDCRQLEVPALLVQPLVENAIRHGIEPKIDGGQIDVSAHVEAGKLTLQVKDTGVGTSNFTMEFTPSVSDSTKNKSESNQPQTGGFGLQNLRDRLQQSFGDKAELNFTSVESETDTGGTLVTIRLPIQKKPLEQN